MSRNVDIRNKTSQPVAFGTLEIPALGAIHMSYGRYAATIKEYDIQKWGLEVNVQATDFKNVSVKDFGAKGDGVSDDTYQIQSAIDYVAENGGGIVNIPIGVFVVSALLVFGNIFLVGESKTDSILKSMSGGLDTEPIVTFIGGEGGMSNLRLVV